MQLLCVQNIALASAGGALSQNASVTTDSSQASSLRMKISGSDILSQISLFTMAGLGIDMANPLKPKDCKKVAKGWAWDVWAYGAAAAYYLISEMVQKRKLSDSQEAMVGERGDLNEVRNDIDALYTMKDGEDTRLDAISKRLDSLNNMKGAMLAVEIIAIIINLAHSTKAAFQDDNCAAEGVGVAAAATCAKAIAINLFRMPKGNNTIMTCFQDTDKMFQKGKKNIMKNIDGGLSLASAINSCTPLHKTEAGQKAEQIMGYAQMGTSLVSTFTGGGGGGGGGGILRSLSDMAINFLVAQTGANCLASAMKIAKILTKKVIGKLKGPVQIGKHIVRIAFYGASLGINAGNIAIVKNRKEEVKQNIGDINRVIQTYEAAENQQVAEGEGEDSSGNSRKGRMQRLAQNKRIGSDEEIASEVMKGMKKMEFTPIKLPVNLHDSPTMVRAIEAFNNVGDSLEKGKWGKTSSEMGFFGKNISKLTKIRDDFRKKLNDKRLAAGVEALDFDKESKAMMAMITNEATTAIELSGGVDAMEKTFKDGKEKKQVQEKKIAGGTQENTKVVSIKNTEKAKEEALDEDFFGEEDWDEELDEGMAMAEGSENLDDYVLEKKDIVKDSGRSLFTLLSVRYLKSAYPKLLEEEK